MDPTGLTKEEQIDIWFDEGRFIPARLANEIMKIMPFVTLQDTGEIWFYKQGIWVPGGEELIRNFVTGFLDEKAKKNYGEEVVYFIRTMTYIEREKFCPPINEIPLRNGIFDINTGQMRAYSDKDYFTTKLQITYDPEAKCERIDKFLSEIVKEEHVILLKEVAAYCLLREYPIHAALMCIGSGANGKSVFLSLLKHMLGQENVTSISIQDLEEKPFAIAQLYQKMANIYPDLSSRSLQDTGRFKMLTGGDMVTAEKKFQQPFNYTSYAKHIYSCNQIPIAYDDSRAFFRRWIIINFPNNFDGPNADKNLLKKLVTEKEISGFFNQLIGVLNTLILNGSFSYSLSIEERRELYKRLSDPVEAFCMDIIEFDSTGYIEKKELYSLFCEYCREKNYTALAENTFSKRMFRIMGIGQSRKAIGGMRIQCYAGLKLKEKEEIGQGSQGSQGNLAILSTQQNTLLTINREKTLTPLTPLTQEPVLGTCDDCNETKMITAVHTFEDSYQPGRMITWRLCEDCDQKFVEPQKTAVNRDREPE